MRRAPPAGREFLVARTVPRQKMQRFKRILIGNVKKKILFALRAKKKGIVKSFLSKKEYNKEKNFLGAAREKKGYSKKLSKQKGIQ